MMSYCKEFNQLSIKITLSNTIAFINYNNVQKKIYRLDKTMGYGVFMFF